MFKGKTKWVLGLLVIVSLVVLVPLVMADEAVTPGYGRWGGDCLMQLTDDQKQQLVPLWQQLRDTQKQLVQKKADLGMLTQEQAATINERIEAQYQNKVEYGCEMGFKAGRQNSRGPGPAQGAGKGQGRGMEMKMKRAGGAGGLDCPFAPAEQ